MKYREKIDAYRPNLGFIGLYIIIQTYLMVSALTIILLADRGSVQLMGKVSIIVFASNVMLLSAIVLVIGDLAVSIIKWLLNKIWSDSK